MNFEKKNCEGPKVKKKPDKNIFLRLYFGNCHHLVKTVAAASFKTKFNIQLVSKL